jgi:hypothetical protein
MTLVVWTTQDLPSVTKGYKASKSKRAKFQGDLFSLHLLFHSHHKLNRELRRKRRKEKKKTKMHNKRSTDWYWN